MNPQGIKCGNRKAQALDQFDSHRCDGRHATTQHVRECFSGDLYNGMTRAEQEAENRAEMEIEARVERFWEEGTEAEIMLRQAEADYERMMGLA